MRALHRLAQTLTVHCTISHQGLSSRTGGRRSAHGLLTDDVGSAHVWDTITCPALFRCLRQRWRPTSITAAHFVVPRVTLTVQRTSSMAWLHRPSLCRVRQLQVAIEPSQSVPRRPSRRVVPMSPSVGDARWLAWLVLPAHIGAHAPQAPPGRTEGSEA
jgi:hypothetical protein